VSCEKKTAELIKMHFRMLSRVGPGKMYYIRCRCPHGKGHLWGGWPIERIVKYRIWGLGKRWAVQKDSKKERENFSDWYSKTSTQGIADTFLCWKQK